MSFLQLSQTDPPIGEALGQVDIFARSLGQADLLPDVPLIEASSDQEWYYIRSAWHLVSLWVRLTFGQMYWLCPPIDPNPPVEASSVKEW